MASLVLCGMLVSVAQPRRPRGVVKRLEIAALLLTSATYTSAQTLSVVSAASYDGAALAPGMIATAFGSQITGAATTGYTVEVRDSAMTAAAAVLSIANGQISFVVPPTITQGMATVTVQRNGSPLG